MSLIEPTENSLAQAEWARRQDHGLCLGTPARVERSFEADAWRALEAEDWGRTVEQARSWQADEPFSRRPAVLGSWAASILVGDFAEAEEFARRGLVATPSSVLLANNLAVARAYRHDVEGAREALHLIDFGGLDDREKIFYRATQGLVAFRAGDPVRGRSLYDEAIASAQRQGEAWLEAMANAHLAVEENRRSRGADCLERVSRLASTLRHDQKRVLERFLDLHLSTSGACAEATQLEIELPAPLRA